MLSVNVNYLLKYGDKGTNLNFPIDFPAKIWYDTNVYFRHFGAIT